MTENFFCITTTDFNRTYSNSIVVDILLTKFTYTHENKHAGFDLFRFIHKVFKYCFAEPVTSETVQYPKEFGYFFLVHFARTFPVLPLWNGNPAPVHIPLALPKTTHC